MWWRVCNTNFFDRLRIFSCLSHNQSFDTLCFFVNWIKVGCAKASLVIHTTKLAYWPNWLRGAFFEPKFCKLQKTKTQTVWEVEPWRSNCGRWKLSLDPGLVIMEYEQTTQRNTIKEDRIIRRNVRQLIINKSKTKFSANLVNSSSF